MRAAGVVAALMIAGCIADPTVLCGDLRCPSGQLCTPGGCATQAAIDSCASLAETNPCLVDAEHGYCIGGSCRVPTCGNGDVEFGEVCDDGNEEFRDGCSGRCDSLEVCGNSIVDPLVGEQCDEGVPGRSHDGCTSTCSAELDTWLPATIHSVDGVARVIAADERRRQLVMFGGYAGGDLDDTWIFDGTRWVLQPVGISPSRRDEAQMAYDPVHERIVLFGGINSTGALADTWLWDGVTWEEVHPAVSPPPHARTTMAFDPITQHVILVGYDDMWSWDGSNWSELHPAQRPPSRSDPVVNRDANQLVLFGGWVRVGVDEQQALDDFWRWDGTTWIQIVGIPKPGPRSSAVSAYDPDGHRLLVFGGNDTQPSSGPQGLGDLGDTWQWTGTAWTRISMGRTPRFGGTFGYDPRSQSFILTGGGNSFTTPPTVERFSGTTWTNITVAAKPAARSAHTAVYDAARGEILLFGGATYPEVADTWSWNGRQWILRAVTGPSARHAQAMAYDGRRREVVMFGGYPATAPATWIWDGTAWSSRSTAKTPDDRQGAAMTYDAERGVVVLFGGFSSTVLNDTWEWDGATWTQRMSAHAPPSRYRHAMVYDQARRRVVLFGGLDPPFNALDDTWEWDGTDWSQAATPVHPFKRAEPAMTYDPMRHRVVLFGTDATSDTWEWDGATWTERVVPLTAPARDRAAMTYDPIRGEIVLFGGSNLNNLSLDDMYVYSFASASIPMDVCLDTDTDGDGLIGCADADCYARCDPDCPPGLDATCLPDRPRCGDGTCSMLENARLCPADCN